MDYAAASSTFASNVGADVTTVYAGSVSAQAGAAATPNNWYVDIPLAAPFVYDPANGDLTVDIASDASMFTGSTPSPVDTPFVATANSTRVYNLTSHLATSGTVQANVGIVMEVTYTPLQLQTTFGNNNNGSAGGAVYFDLDVTHPAGITVTGLDVNLITAASISGVIDVYTCVGSRSGNQTNPAVWSRVATGAVTSAGAGAHSTVAISPFSLPFGTTGVALAAIGVGHAYTNGNGSNQNYSSPYLNIACGEATNVALSASGGFYSPRVANCQFSYHVGLTGSQATSTAYGAGCQSQVASFYENFATAASFDLNHTAMTMIRTNPGYQVFPGGVYVPPSGAATVLSLGDDAQVLSPALATPFPYDGGTATQLMVCSNGFVSVATGNGTGFTPNVAAMLSASQTSWRCWHDFDPSITSGGRVKFEEVGPIVYVTWDGVWDYGGTTAANANSFQFQFNTSNGSVTFAWATMSPLGGTSNTGFLVGYSPGGASSDPTNRDLSATLPATFTISGADGALTLTSAQRPIPGNSIDLVTSNNNPSTIFGAVLLGLSQFPSGISLAPQMAGCFQYNDGMVVSPLFFGGAATQVTSFPVPNALGMHVYAQSAVFCPAANLTLLGAVSSNGLDLGIGGY